MNNSVVTPGYISKELFEKALTSYFKQESLQILQHITEPAIPVGENFASDIFRSTVTYSIGNRTKKQSISVIIKSFPQNEMMRNLAHTVLIFEDEAYIFTNILPAVNNILGNSEQISPKCIHYVKNPNSLIIFEDLSALNFKMHPRQQGLDLQHCLLVVEKLAYLHAASLVLYEKNPSPINKFTEGAYGTSDFIANWVSTALDALIKASSKWPGFEKYVVKLEALHDTALERIFKAKELGHFNILNHGDCWINNVMFSYNSDGQVNDLRFVDFQLVLYGSPTLDLNYFFATSPNIEVRRQHLVTMLDHYYVKLINTLKRLNYPLQSIPSREQLQKDFNSRAFYGLIGAVIVLPVITAPSRNDATIQALLAVDGNEDGFQHNAFNNDLYKAHMEFLLPFYDKLGVLD